MLSLGGDKLGIDIHSFNFLRYASGKQSLARDAATGRNVLNVRSIPALNPWVPFHIQYADRTARTAVFLFLCANPRRSTRRHS